MHNVKQMQMQVQCLVHPGHDGRDVPAHPPKDVLVDNSTPYCFVVVLLENDFVD